MASKYITKYNTLKELIGEVLCKQSTKPIMVCPYHDGYIQEKENNIIIYNQNMGIKYEYKTHCVAVTVSSNTIYVFEKHFICSKTGKSIPSSDIFELSKYYACTEFSIRAVKDINSFHNIIPVITTGKYHFVFNITDVKTLLLAFLLAQNKRREMGQICLPTEVIVKEVLPFINFIKFDENDEIICKNNIRCDYKFKFPKYFSKAQIKKLFKLDMIKMAAYLHCNPFDKVVGTHKYSMDCASQTMILSDKSFNRTTLVSQSYGSIENMHAFIKKQLNNLGI